MRIDETGVPRVRTRGWVTEHALSLWDLMSQFTAAGLKHVLCTDIELRRCARRPEPRAVPRSRASAFRDTAWQASGGVRDVGDLARLADLGRRRGDQRQGAARGSLPARGATAILARRLIPCLDVRDGQVVKGVQFRDHRVVGDILELAERYRDQQADELVFYDITASPQGRSVDRSWIGRVARVLDIPFCVAGGIRCVADAEAVLNAGAEKISVNSPALADPSLIDALARRFGSQCVVAGIDSQTTPDGFRVYQFTGDPDRTRDTRRDTLAWVREVQDRGPVRSF